MSGARPRDGAGRGHLAPSPFRCLHPGLRHAAEDRGRRTAISDPESDTSDTRSLSGGATFGTWEKQIEALVKAGPIPELPELEGALDPGGVLGTLRELRVMRNDTGNGGFTLIGRRLQGSHPDWEPFERPFPDLLDPDRIYVDSPSFPRPLPLWPIARAEVCEDCDARELFLFHKFDRASGDISLRCGRDHTFPRDDT